MSEKNIPSELRYTRSHEWVRGLANGLVEVGITDYAQGELGDLVFVKVPQPERRVSADEACAVVESVKAASDVHSPVAGRIVAANAELAQQPVLVNDDPYGEGWLMRVEIDPAAGAPVLLTAAEYAQFLAAI